jgi:DNA repair exonuclease SbcCD ATPase subunit
MNQGLVFHSITLIDFPFFKKQTFVLDSGNINLVLGQNFNGGGVTNPNGAGKSLFFSQIIEFITDEPIIGVKKDKIRRGTRILEFSKAGKRYKVTRSFTDGREKIVIERNGKDLGLRELKEAKAVIDRVIGLSKEELYTFVYLDSSVGHPLIHGDTAVRKSFFVSFFKQFGILSNFRKLVATQVDLCKTDLVRIEEAQGRMQSLQAKLPSVSLKKLKSVVDNLQEESDSLASTIPELIRANDIKDKYFSVSKKLKSLCLELQISELEDVSNKRKEIRSKGRMLSQEQDSLDRYNDWAKQNKAASARITELESRVQTTANLEELQSKLEALNTRKSELVTGFNKTRNDLENLKEQVLDLENNKKRTTHKIQHLESDAGKCPTCGGEYVDRNSIRELKEAKSNLRTTATKLVELQDKLKETEANKDEFKTRLEKINLSISKLEEKFELVSEYASLTSAKAKSPVKPKYTQDQITLELSGVDIILDQLSSIVPMFELKDEWSKVDLHIKAQLKSLDLASINQKMLDISSKLAAASVEYKLVSSIKDEISEISDRICELNSKVEDLDSLKVLESAFSKKGIELILIRSLCSSLEQQVNKYSKLIFPEDYTFTFELDTNFSILVTRVHNKQAETSDVRKLSGAERKLFSLVLLISLLTFIPKSKRTNLLVLDEPTAAMGEDNKASLIRFLPVLQSIIPNIVVITPLDKQDYAVINPKVWTVQKKGLHSRIIEGAPK